MTTYILLLFFHVRPLGHTDSNSSLIVSGFTSEQNCIDAGIKAKQLVKNTVKQLEFTCLQQTGH